MMHKPIYREALKEAWMLVWRNTSLWLLGLISVLFAGSFGLGNFFSQIMVTMGTGGNASWLLNFEVPPLGVSKLGATFWLLWLIGIVVVVAIAVIYISVNAKTALLLAMADYYKKRTMPKLANIWNRGLKFFWKIFTIEILRKAVLIVTVIIFGIIWICLPFTASGLNMAINIVMLCLTVILGLIASAVAMFASGYSVIEEKSIGDALKNAWKLFHEHLLVSFEISAILTLVDLALIAGFAAVVSFSFIPSLFVWIIAGAFGSQALAIFGAFFGFVVLLLFIALVGAVYNTFYTSVWMYLFMKMHHQGIASRLYHHIGKLFAK